MNVKGRLLQTSLVIFIILITIGVIHGCVLVCGCSPPPADTDIEPTLKSLFPDLDEAEITHLSIELNSDDVRSLKEDLVDAREKAKEFSLELSAKVKEESKTRKETLVTQNNGFPEKIEPLGVSAAYSAGDGIVTLNISGIFRNEDYVRVNNSNIEVMIDGISQTTATSCLYDGDEVDIIFLLDITGSMSDVIEGVKESMSGFIDVITASGIKGKIGVVTYQDTVGVNIDFQHPVPGWRFERSPFFKPVNIGDSAGIIRLKTFLNRLEANRGDDIPENLAGAIDFARNNIIGYKKDGKPNIIGDWIEDPTATTPYDVLTGKHQVFIVLTDAAFHSDNRNSDNSSLRKEFIPRKASDILQSLKSTGTVVHVVDPGWIDAATDPAGTGKSVDADYWAIETGGVGYDNMSGHSITDLEVFINAKKTGLLSISLDDILASTCYVKFNYPGLTSNQNVELLIRDSGETYNKTISVERL